MDFKKIKQTLKKEFIGIDHIIDRVVDSVRTWYIFDSQRRPTIINLWGMTGSGKTKLINRLIDLLELNDDFYPINMGDHGTLHDDLKEIGDDYNTDSTGKSKIAFLFDDFHVCKTIGPDKIDSNIGMIWDLLDSGTIKIKSRLIETWDEFHIRKEMAVIYKNKLQNKKVKDCYHLLDTNLETYWGESESENDTLLKKLNESTEKNDKPTVTTMLSVDTILKINNRLKIFDFGTNDVEKCVNLIENIKYSELIGFFNQAINVSNGFVWTYDFTKSIIFVTGNIDELYSGSAQDMDDDEDPDFVKSQLGDITFMDLKNILVNYYFRPEHISRLGSNHIIYNAFTTEEYRLIVQRYLEELNEIYNTNITFDKSIVDIIFDESVIASQGVRPILSSIHYMIETHMPDIVMKFKRRKVTAKYNSKEKKLTIGKSSFDVLLINRCYEYEKDTVDFARTVVHESGHAFIHYKLFNKVPEFLVIKNNSSTYGGYVIASRQEVVDMTTIKNKVGFYLGGMLAEEIIFGSSSNGASQDLEYATSELTYMLTKLGLGHTFEVTKSPYEKDEGNPKNTSKEVEELLQELATLCRNILTENKDEFAKLCKKVHDKCKMSEEDFMEHFGLKDNDSNHESDLNAYKNLIGGINNGDPK